MCSCSSGVFLGGGGGGWDRDLWVCGYELEGRMEGRKDKSVKVKV